MACMKLKYMIQYLLAFEFLLLPTLNPLHFMAEGRKISKYSDLTMRINEEVKMRGVIGSKPPRCDSKKCKSCGHCEAVQVPIVAAKKFIFRKHEYYSHESPTIHMNNIAYSRGDYISNYKPMCWKCKCGDLYFNPGG